MKDILVVDNLGTSEKWRNLAGKQISDYLHKDQFLKLVESNSIASIKAIVHLGACSSTTETDADYMLRNNYQYSKILAQFALKTKIRFIYASSAATYGAGEFGFEDSEQTALQLRPLNVYALSKQLLDLWAIQTGAIEQIVGLKFFNVYGPNEYHKQDMRSVVLKSFEQIQSTGKVSLFKSYRPDFGDGEQKRDFVYVKDCCEAIYQLLNRTEINGIYNLGSGNARSWKDLVSAVFSALGKQTNIEFIDMPEQLKPKYQYFTEAKMEKLSSRLGSLSLCSLEEAVRDYVQNYLLKDKSHF